MNLVIKKFKKNCIIIDIPADIFNDDVLEDCKETMKDLADNDYKTFFLNMSQISKVNSKSLASIINIYQFSAYYDMEVKLFNLQPYVSQLIYQTRLNQIFDICDPDCNILEDSSKNKRMSA